MFPWEHTQFPSTDDYNIPTLRLDKQATTIDHPVINWGNTRRTDIFSGTYCFYCDDYRFSRLTKKPDQLIDTQCRTAIEVNFSTRPTTPRAQVLYDIFRKRWLARYWQEFDINIIVDLNVMSIFADDNFRGIPKGWKAYCTRSHRISLEQLQEQFHRACTHADTDDILFTVYGGGKYIASLCQQYHWIWIPDERHLLLQQKSQQKYG